MKPKTIIFKKCPFSVHSTSQFSSEKKTYFEKRIASNYGKLRVNDILIIALQMLKLWTNVTDMIGSAL